MCSSDLTSLLVILGSQLPVEEPVSLSVTEEQEILISVNRDLKHQKRRTSSTVGGLLRGPGANVSHVVQLLTLSKRRQARTLVAM